MNNIKDLLMPGLIKSVDDYIYCYGYRQLKSYIEKTVKEELEKSSLNNMEKRN